MFLFFFIIIFCKLIAEIERDAIQFDVILVDGLHNLSHLVRSVLGFLLTICDQEDSLSVFSWTNETAKHVQAHDQAIQHISFILLNLFCLKILHLSEKVEIYLSHLALSGDILVFVASHLLIELIRGVCGTKEYQTQIMLGVMQQLLTRKEK